MQIVSEMLAGSYVLVIFVEFVNVFSVDSSYYLKSLLAFEDSLFRYISLVTQVSADSKGNRMRDGLIGDHS